MTIATLILTCLLFVALGWTGDAYGPVALCVGAVVCIAAANAGATSQDLKTGYIVGATPLYQQIGLIIGVVVSALVIGLTTLYLHRVFGDRLGRPSPAPQATLMATIIKGLLSQNLPWGLVLVGVFISVTLELCGIHSLSFAVGSYLPIATTAPDLRRRARALVGGAAQRRHGGVGARRRHALQLRADRRRFDLRHSVRGAGRHGDHRPASRPSAMRCRGSTTKAALAHIAGGLLFLALAGDHRARRAPDDLALQSWCDAVGRHAATEPRERGLVHNESALASWSSRLAVSVRRSLPRRAGPPTSRRCLAHPTFYHLRPIVVVGTLTLQANGELRMQDDTAIASASSSRTARPDGLSEVRGEFWDLGRMNADDPRLGRRTTCGRPSRSIPTARGRDPAR